MQVPGRRELQHARAGGVQLRPRARAPAQPPRAHVCLRARHRCGTPLLTWHGPPAWATRRRHGTRRTKPALTLACTHNGDPLPCARARLALPLHTPLAAARCQPLSRAAFFVRAASARPPWRFHRAPPALPSIIVGAPTPMQATIPACGTALVTGWPARRAHICTDSGLPMPMRLAPRIALHHELRAPNACAHLQPALRAQRALPAARAARGAQRAQPPGRAHGAAGCLRQRSPSPLAARPAARPPRLARCAPPAPAPAAARRGLLQPFHDSHAVSRCGVDSCAAAATCLHARGWAFSRVMRYNHTIEQIRRKSANA